MSAELVLGAWGAILSTILAALEIKDRLRNKVVGREKEVRRMLQDISGPVGFAHLHMDDESIRSLVEFIHNNKDKIMGAGTVFYKTVPKSLLHSVLRLVFIIRDRTHGGFLLIPGNDATIESLRSDLQKNSFLDDLNADILSWLGQHS